MATRQKTVDFAWTTNTAALAATTNFDFAAKTLDLPETSGRVYRSARLVVTCRGTETAATSMTGVTVALNIAAGAFTNIINVTDTMTNSGEQQSFTFVGDATSWFTTNFTGTSGSVGVRVNFAGLGTICITAEIQICYDFDDAGLTTVVETLRIPLDASTTALTSTIASIGTNQVPQITGAGGILDGLVSVVIKQVYFVIESNELAGATTDFNLFVELDTEGETTRSTLEQSLNSACRYYDIWNRDALSVTVAHDFRARSSLATRFSNLSVIMKVTFTYDVSSGSNTKCVQSLMIPIDVSSVIYVNGTAAGDQDVIKVQVLIPEPATVTLIQSGIKLWVGSLGTNTAFNLACGAQADRAYTLSTPTASCSLFPITHRIDSGGASGSGITFARGYVTLTIEFRAGNTICLSGGVLFLNYSSGIPSAGRYAANTNVMLPLLAFAADANIRSSASVGMAIAPTDFYLNGVGIVFAGLNSAINITPIPIYAEILSGEGVAAAGDGWELLDDFVLSPNVENHTYDIIGGCLKSFRQHPNTPLTDLLNIETARIWRLTTPSTSLLIWSSIWLTAVYSSITFTKSRTVGGYGGSGSGLTVDMHRASDDKIMRRFTTGASGAYSSVYFDDTETYYETCNEDATHVGRSPDFTFA